MNAQTTQEALNAALKELTAWKAAALATQAERILQGGAMNAQTTQEALNAALKELTAWKAAALATQAERDALAAQVAEFVVYEWREIGGGDWCVCDESWLNHCQNDPTLDARKRIKGAAEILAEAAYKALTDVQEEIIQRGLYHSAPDFIEQYAMRIRQGEVK